MSHTYEVGIYNWRNWFMEMRQCEQGGHYYDASIYSQCPYCSSGVVYPYTSNMKADTVYAMGGGASDATPTVNPMMASAMTQQPGNPSLSAQSIGTPTLTPPTITPQPQTGENRTVSMFTQSPQNDGRTVAIIQKDMGIDPVVGWLVCVRGKEKGRDYRIHCDNNFIGRSEKMDVCVRGDETISRENHAIISFDARDRVYYFSPGDGRSIVRVNNRAIFQTTTLCAYDIIEIGRTSLMFVPLCGERFEWTKEV